MARRSKKAEKEVQVADRQEVIWNAGIYARLSVDNHNQKNESIDTQIEIAKDYIRHSGDIKQVDCYTDLGKTGTDFQREGFERLMADIRCHKINCVIVKDFSRFGRNYIETGNYIEKIFPFFNVRFIAVSDGYDSHKIQGDNDIFAVNLKNVINELYAKDCAEKVRAIKKAKMEQGCYVGGIPAYGYYGKWIDGKKVLFPEEGTSDVVRKVYELFDKGCRIRDIISYLYEQRIHRPKEYQSTGHVYCMEGERLRQWADQTIRAIVTNPVYIGALVQIREDEKILHNKGMCTIESDQVIMVEHTHEALVDEDVFYRIAAKIEEKRKKELQRKKLRQDVLQEDLYKDLLYCGECGHKMKRIASVNAKSYQISVRTYSYGCPHIGRIDDLKCDSHYISQNSLNRIVQETLKKEFDLSGIRMKSLVDFNRNQAEAMEKQSEKRKQKLQERIRELDIEMSSLYVEYKTGSIDKEVFLERKADKEALKRNLIKEVSEQQEDAAHRKKEMEDMNRFIRCLWKGKDDTVLDGTVIHYLIKRITVYKDKRVEIIFNFCKEQFENLKKEACGK
ncbi:MAG: recombinase family protein [Eubacteriales bacterium]|nr:recombinase family protein [Eubacteriales bacterium]